MKPQSIFLSAALCAVAMLPTLNAASVDRSKAPEAGPFPKVVLPKTISETLPNGLRIFILQDHREPTVTYRLLIKSGNAYDGDKPGRAALTAALLNKGTAELSAEEFARKTDFLGVTVEATASDDSISIFASGLARDSSQLLGFLRDVALHPAFLQQELDKEKIQTISSLVQAKANPGVLAGRLRNKLVYGEHPYGAFPTPESVRSLTRDDLIAFHKSYFVPNNATLAIVGDVDPEKALASAKEAFGDWKKADLPEKQFPAFPELKGVTYHVVDRPASVQSNLMVVGKGIARNNPDLRQLSVVNSVLGGGFSGRLFGNLREKHGFTYGSYSSFDADKLGGTFSASAEVRNEVTEAAAKEMFNELNRITTEPIPNEELSLQRNYLVGNYLLSLENNRRMAERLQAIDLFGLPQDYYTTYPQQIMEVTPEKAQALAGKYIDTKNLAVVVVGNAKEVYPQLEKLGPVTVYNADLKPVEPPKVEKAPEATPEPAKAGE